MVQIIFQSQPIFCYLQIPASQNVTINLEKEKELSRKISTLRRVLSTINVQNEINQRNIGNIPTFKIEDFSGSKVSSDLRPTLTPLPQTLHPKSEGALTPMSTEYSIKNLHPQCWEP